MIFHLDYSEKACQDHATLVIFNNSLKTGSHDPIFGSDFYSNSKKLQTRINQHDDCQHDDDCQQIGVKFQINLPKIYYC